MNKPLDVNWSILPFSLVVVGVIVLLLDCWLVAFISSVG